MSTEPLKSQTTADKANLDNTDGKHRQNYLETELKKRIKWFKNESKKHKKMFRRLRYTVFGLTACSSALAGLALAFPGMQTEITVAIILTTAVMGIATSIEGVRKPNELWIHERMIYYSLLDLQRELDYFTSDPTDPKSTDTYFEQLQSILGSSRDKWSREIVASATAAARRDSVSPEGSSANPSADSK